MTPLRTAMTELGRFREVSKEGPLEDRWIFECPGCQEEAYLDGDQWAGRVSVDHATQGCAGRYHETHDYRRALEAALLGDVP